MSHQPHVLFIGSVFPEPTSSAAGSRILQLITFFKEQNYSVYFASSALVSPYAFPLENWGIQLRSIELNSPTFDTMLMDIAPNVVVFDRFTMEEQYSWRVKEHCPNAMRILDTEDLHFLRSARQIAVKNNATQLNFQQEITYREIASIQRCDVSLIIANYEMDLLINTFSIAAEKLFYLPFLMDSNVVDSGKDFDQCSDFFFIGNFLHAPNVDAVVQLKTEIWPRIRKQLPNALLKIYGAYPTQMIQQMHQPKEGFLVLGRAENVRDVMKAGRVNLAPLRFGAGLKGKLLDGLLYARPSVTTTVGAEGMYVDNWHGCIADDWDDFANAAVRLYTNELVWDQANEVVFSILAHVFERTLFLPKLADVIQQFPTIHTQNDPNQFELEMLNFHSFQKMKYFSRWIEEKKKNKA